MWLANPTWRCAALTLALLALGTAGRSGAAPPPAGPIEILADDATAEGDRQILTGNVRISSPTLKLSGARVELEQRSSGQLKATVSGSPARAEHAAGSDAQGRSWPAMSATAQTVIYDSSAGTIELQGNVQLTRGTDSLSGGAITYTVASRAIRAQRTDDAPVRLVIEAPEALAEELQDKEQDTPAPADGGPAP